MRRFVFHLLAGVTCLLSPEVLSAQCGDYCQPPCGYLAGTAEPAPCLGFLEKGCCLDFCDYRFQVSFGPTWREDNLTWSIAGPDGFPNVLSQLSWKNLKMWLGDLRTRWIVSDFIYIRAKADYGKIFQGKNRDSDYLGDDRTFEFSRSDNAAGRGEVFDLSFGMGLFFPFCQRRIQIAPLGGYFYSEQHLKMYHGNQTISFLVDDDIIEQMPLGPFEGLHSNYMTSWQGPWAGVDISWELYRDWIVFGSFEYYWIVRYKGKGHWNLRTDFVKDFEHFASSGNGTSVMIGTAVRMACWKLSVLGEMLNVHTNHGIDRTFFIDGEVKTRLNHVRWHSCRFSVLASYTF